MVVGNREGREEHEEGIMWVGNTDCEVYQVINAFPKMAFRGGRGMKTPCVSLRWRDGREAKQGLGDSRQGLGNLNREEHEEVSMRKPKNAQKQLIH